MNDFKRDHVFICLVKESHDVKKKCVHFANPGFPQVWFLLRTTTADLRAHMFMTEAEVRNFGITHPTGRHYRKLEEL